jgi:hypothetical protein
MAIDCCVAQRVVWLARFQRMRINTDRAHEALIKSRLFKGAP